LFFEFFKKYSSEEITRKLFLGLSIFFKMQKNYKIERYKLYRILSSEWELTAMKKKEIFKILRT